MRRSTTTTVAAALFLAACGSSADDGQDTAAPEPPPNEEEAGDPPDDAEPNTDQTSPDDPLADLPDLQGMVEDGTFRGEGIVLPIPEGWQIDPVTQLQGQGVLASEGAESLQQIAGQAVDVGSLPEPISFDELLESNRQQFEEAPEVDEEIQIEGAEQAHQLRYDALPPVQEGLPEVSLVLIVAEDGDGRLGSFNYAASTDEFEDAKAERLLEVAGFDPGSDPTPPQLPEVETETDDPAAG